jgi:Arc/MetJ family transcription regulator
MHDCVSRWSSRRQDSDRPTLIEAGMPAISTQSQGTLTRNPPRRGIRGVAAVELLGVAAQQQSRPTLREYTRATPKVYSWCMAKVRTNIEIEDSYVQAVMDRYGVRTKTEAVDLALRHLAGQPMTREEALAMRGANAIGETPSEVAPTAAT